MDRPKWTDIAIAFLTVGIVILAYMQWREMHGAGEQTDKIISAANLQASAANKIAEASDRNAAAAERFSKSAGAISAGVSDAVGKLQIQADETRELAKNALIQAKATKDLAEQAKVSADIARDALTKSSRPWMGVDGPLVGAVVIGEPVEISHPLSVGQPPQTQVKTRINLVVKNFGKDPAFFVTSDASIISNQIERDPSKMFAEYKWGVQASCQMADIRRDDSIVPGEKGSGPTLFPNDTNPESFPSTTASPNMRLDGPLIVVGCISYRDQFFVSHHTKFCYTSGVSIASVAMGQKLYRCNFVGAD